ncbi:MAG: hypothetical protein M3Q60_21720 [Actinomycetota bacterium]|nr:hypothetical protein [Actinomycetota bacterium]
MYSRETNAIPDPGQQVKLLGRRGRRLPGRYRTLSGPLTDPKDGVVIWVAEEHEYQEALQEGRRAEGMSWPVRQMEVISPSEDHREGAQEAEGTARRPWWRRILGG